MELKKNILFYLFCILFASSTYSQVLTQDASGNSTILYNGGNIGINLGESELSVNYNKFNFDRGETSKHVYGVGAKGKNDKGLASLLSGGEFVANATFSGFYGTRWNNFKSSDYESLELPIRLLEEEIKNLRKEAQSQILDILEKAIRTNIDDEDKRNALILSFNQIIPKQDIIEFDGWFDSKFKNTKEEDEKKFYEEAIRNTKPIVEKFHTVYKTNNDTLTRLNDELNTKYKEQPPFLKQLLVLRGSFNTIGYNKFGLVDSVNLSNNFKEKTFGSGSIDLVYNLEKKNYIIGVSAGFNFTGNVDSLKKFKYVLESVPITSKDKTQQIKTSKEFSGYKDSPTKVTYCTLNFDFVKFFPVNNSDKNAYIVAWNVYMRNNFSYLKKVMPSYSNLGTGIYFMKSGGKFLGGLYTELFDIFNGTYDESSDPFISKVSFGVVTKFAFMQLLKDN